MRDIIPPEKIKESYKYRKEVDQRYEHNLLFRCSCGWPHFVDFCWDEDDSEWGLGFWVEVIDLPSGLWERIKRALRYILKGGKLYQQEVSLTSTDLKQLKKHINEYLTWLKKPKKNIPKK